MKIISLLNQKGGVSKTTTTANLGSILSEEGYKVLVVDLDAQANLTNSLGLDMEDSDRTIYEVLTRGLPLKEAIYETEFGVDILPSNMNLADTELNIANEISRESILKKIFEKSDIKYDYVILDLPPSLGLITLNALTLSNYLIIPVDVGVFSLAGINQLMKVVQIISEDNLNDSLEILGVLLTKADDRMNMTLDIRQTLDDIFENKVFDVYIHHNSKILESQQASRPINYFDRNSRGYLEYKELAKEVIKRVQG